MALTFVRCFHVRRAPGDEFKVETLGEGLIERNHIRPAKLQIPGNHTLNDDRAAGHRNRLELQPLAFEKSFFHSHEHRRVIDDFHVTELFPGLRPGYLLKHGDGGNGDRNCRQEISARDDHIVVPLSPYVNGFAKLARNACPVKDFR